jgi:hypothetical protein
VRQHRRLDELDDPTSSVTSTIPYGDFNGATAIVVAAWRSRWCETNAAIGNRVNIAVEPEPGCRRARAAR